MRHSTWGWRGTPWAGLACRWVPAGRSDQPRVCDRTTGPPAGRPAATGLLDGARRPGARAHGVHGRHGPGRPAPARDRARVADGAQCCRSDDTRSLNSLRVQIIQRDTPVIVSRSTKTTALNAAVMQVSGNILVTQWRGYAATLVVFWAARATTVELAPVHVVPITVNPPLDPAA